MSGRLRGKVAAIAGAGSGIGAETARVFVANGACVAVADLQEEPGIALAEALGGAARFARCYVTREVEAAGLTKSVASDLAVHGIRVNAVAPGNSVTAMTAAVIAGDFADSARTEAKIACTPFHDVASQPIREARKRER
jgi:NAD(P)-dependent dehydrogenase (short-subunit alcohol dehydrogenase family)